MKANKVPERIWIDTSTDLPKLCGHIDKNSIEYVRTNAFIEKAVEWLECNNTLPDGEGSDYIDDFRKYMRGE